MRCGACHACGRCFPSTLMTLVSPVLEVFGRRNQEGSTSFAGTIKLHVTRDLEASHLAFDELFRRSILIGGAVYCIHNDIEADVRKSRLSCGPFRDFVDGGLFTVLRGSLYSQAPTGGPYSLQSCPLGNQHNACMFSSIVCEFVAGLVFVDVVAYSKMAA